MADREYVIKCLKYLHDRETWKEGPLVYDDKAADRRQITADALALLREQEPVKRGKWKMTDAYPHDVYCSICYKTFAQSHWEIWKDGSMPRNFCPNCGAKMEDADD